MNTNKEYDWSQTRTQILHAHVIAPDLWHVVEEYAQSLLVKGRPNFDLPHTRAVVYWVYCLGVAHNGLTALEDISRPTVDIPVLITAAWLHDIGYFGQFEGMATAKEVQDKKILHMEIGARMARQFLEEYAVQWLSSDQIEQVVYLVSIHDDLDKIVDILETILMEADTLGMMDVEKVEPTYQGQEALQFPNQPKTQKRVGLFKTRLGQRMINIIISNFQKHIINRDFKDADEKL